MMMVFTTTKKPRNISKVQKHWNKIKIMLNIYKKNTRRVTTITKKQIRL